MFFSSSDKALGSKIHIYGVKITHFVWLIQNNAIILQCKNHTTTSRSLGKEQLEGGLQTQKH